MTKDKNDKPGQLLRLVQALIISPQDAQALADNYHRQARHEAPRESEQQRQDRVAQKIVARYARISSLVGGASGLTGLIPGMGTAVAVLGGATGDTALTMKLQVDMTMCLAANYGYDLTSDDGLHLAFLLAAGGALEKAGVEAGTRLASQAGVRMLRQYLRGAALKTIKELFKQLGVVFTRKALEKAVPFGVGVALGSGANYYLTRYVGQQAITWFRLDRDTP